MTNADLKKLGKNELIEIILKLKQDNAVLYAALEDAKKEITEQSKVQLECGSIAEQAIKVNGVLEAAQKAADEYLAEVKRANSDTEDKCNRMLRETALKCKKLLDETNAEIARRKAEFNANVDRTVSVYGELSDAAKRK